MLPKLVYVSSQFLQIKLFDSRRFTCPNLYVKNCPQALLRQKAQEGEKSQELLEDKKQELLLRQHETQHVMF